MHAAASPSTPRLRPIRGRPRPHDAVGRRALLWRICPPGAIWSPGRSAGRWHAAGEPMVYAALSPALAALEALAHRDGGDLALAHRIGWAEPPAGSRLVLRETELPSGWLDDEHRTREFGSAWLASKRSLLLFVPSALVPHAYNVLINAAHPAWAPMRLRCGEDGYRFDRRLR